MSTSVPTDQPPAHALGLDPRPLTAHVGAKIFGVDPSAPLSAEVVGEIRATLCRWKVVPPYHNQLPIARGEMTCALNPVVPDP